MCSVFLNEPKQGLDLSCGQGFSLFQTQRGTTYKPGRGNEGVSSLCQKWAGHYSLRTSASLPVTGLNLASLIPLSDSKQIYSCILTLTAGLTSLRTSDFFIPKWEVYCVVEDSESTFRQSRPESLGDLVMCSLGGRGAMAAAETALSPKTAKFCKIHLKNIVKRVYLTISWLTQKKFFCLQPRLSPKLGPQQGLGMVFIRKGEKNHEQNQEVNHLNSIQVCSHFGALRSLPKISYSEEHTLFSPTVLFIQ